MNDLEALRKEIDEIDAKMTALFEKRMDVVLRIVEFKRTRSIGVYEESRERRVVEQNVLRLKNPAYGEALKRFFITLMGLSRELQNDINRRAAEKKAVSGDISVADGPVGYPGIGGSFSEEAALSFFGESRQTRPYEDFESVFAALSRGEIAFGVLPIENSLTGGIAQVYDLLSKYDFSVCGEKHLRVDQHLVGLPGATLEGIKEVYSHPQGFEQSAEFLKNHSDWKLIPYHNTAVSAKMVSLAGRPEMAAVAGRRAAELYGLSIVRENINSDSENTTRFVIVGKTMNSPAESDKASVVFSLDDRAGTLYRLLGYFSENGVNMTRIESRPMKSSPWKYLLYIDFECPAHIASVRRALDGVRENSAYFKLLGFYKKDVI